MLKFLQGIDDLSEEMKFYLFLLAGFWTFFAFVLAASLSQGNMDAPQSPHAICESSSTTQENN